MALHNDLGKLGELVAARHLIMQGYSILSRDYRVGHKDIDIVASKDGTVVFVEVKTRQSNNFGEPEEAVTDEKIRNLISAANAYVQRYNVIGPIRFDVISLVGTEEPFEIKHIEGAFDPLSLSNYKKW